MKQWNWKRIILFLLAIPVLNFAASYLGESAAQHVNERKSGSAPQSSSNQEIKVVVTSQDSGGTTQRDFDLNFLKSLEAYTVERVKIKTKEYLTSQGYPNADINFTSEATYVESGPTKLAVIRLHSSEGSTQVFIAGIVGNQLKRIACVRSSAGNIPVSYGVCAEKIKEVFGVRVGG